MLGKPTLRQPDSIGISEPTKARPLRVLAEHHVDSTIFDTHSHPEFSQLICSVEGTLRVKCAREEWIIPPRHGLLLPPNTSHSVTTPAQAVARVVNIHPPAIISLTNGDNLIEISDLLVTLLDRASSFREDYDVNGAHGRVAAVILDEIIGAKRANFRLLLGRDKRVRRITETLLDNPKTDLTLDRWSKIVGASSRNLSRLFSHETGMNFKTYRRQAQIHFAILQLSKGESIASVADDSGYDSVSAFIFAFRSLTGTTPRRFISLRNDGE